MRYVLAAAAALLATTSASATIQTFYFSGLDQNGSRMTGSIAYDDAVAPLFYDDGGGINGVAEYRALTDFNMAGSNWAVAFVGAGTGRNVAVYNAGRGSVDTISFDPAAGDLFGGFIPGYTFAGANLFFDTTDDVWPTPALPDTSSFPTMQSKFWTVGFLHNDGGPTASFAGELDYVGATPFAAVPEPANWALLITGFGLLGAAARGRSADLRVSYSRSSG
jgi:hypothetical protein